MGCDTTYPMLEEINSASGVITTIKEPAKEPASIDANGVILLQISTLTSNLCEEVNNNNGDYLPSLAKIAVNAIRCFILEQTLRFLT